VTKSSNHTLSLHRLTSNSSSTTNFPWLSPADNFHTPADCFFKLSHLQSRGTDRAAQKSQPLYCCQSQSHIATDSQSLTQSVSLGVEPHLGLMTRYFYCLTVTVLFLWGALSDEGAGLSFVHGTGPCQRSFSRVRVPCNS
jgi:hypothetical protein